MIPCQRHLFDIPDDVAYLNCAYMSPLMKPGLEAGTAGLARKAHPWEITPDKFFTGADEFRGTAAQLFGSSADDIAIVPSASYGIATAARNLPVKKGQSILVLEEQFPSNYYSWQRRAEETGASLKVVPWPEDNDWTAAVLGALTSEVAIAALPHVQWTSGGRLDLVRIGQACRKIGSALVLDLTQSLGALPFSVGSLGDDLENGVQPDFAVAASYKWLLGPYSVGLLYVAPKWQGGKPLEENWIQRGNARDFSSLILYTEEYDAGARRFDMGERANFALLPAAVHAMNQLLEWKVGEVSETGRSSQSPHRRCGGWAGFLRARRTVARAALPVAAEKYRDSQGTSRNPCAGKGICQRPGEIDSSGAARLQYGRRLRTAHRLFATYRLNEPGGKARLPHKATV